MNEASNPDLTLHQKTVKGGTEINKMLRKVGKKITPEGCVYQGSMAIHFFKSRFDSSSVSHNVTQICIDDVNEMSAQVGFKALGRRVMEGYGRKAPKKRNEKFIEE